MFGRKNFNFKTNAPGGNPFMIYHKGEGPVAVDGQGQELPKPRVVPVVPSSPTSTVPTVIPMPPPPSPSAKVSKLSGENRKTKAPGGNEGPVDGRGQELPKPKPRVVPSTPNNRVHRVLPKAPPPSPASPSAGNFSMTYHKGEGSVDGQGQEPPKPRAIPSTPTNLVPRVILMQSLPSPSAKVNKPLGENGEDQKTGNPLMICHKEEGSANGQGQELTKPRVIPSTSYNYVPRVIPRAPPPSPASPSAEVNKPFGENEEDQKTNTPGRNPFMIYHKEVGPVAIDGQSQELPKPESRVVNSTPTNHVPGVIPLPPPPSPSDKVNEPLGENGKHHLNVKELEKRLSTTEGKVPVGFRLRQMGSPALPLNEKKPTAEPCKKGRNFSPCSEEDFVQRAIMMTNHATNSCSSDNSPMASKNLPNMKDMKITVIPSQGELKLVYEQTCDPLEIQPNPDDLLKMMKADIKTKLRPAQSKFTQMKSFVSFCCTGDVPKIVYYIFKGYVNPNDELTGHLSALHYAAAFAQEEAVKTLLELGSNVNSRRKHDNFTPLMAAASHGKKENRSLINCVIRLLHAGAKINAVQKSGRTPLLYAAERGHVAIVELLLMKGADFSIRDLNGHNGYDYARRNHDKEMKYLLKPYDLESRIMRLTLVRTPSTEKNEEGINPLESRIVSVPFVRTASTEQNDQEQQ